MAFPNLTLIGALRQAAANLKQGAHYAWGHHGACNCGHVLQVVTHLTKEEILKQAHTGIGEWTELAEEYCDVTGAPAYMLVSKLEAIGLTPTDIHCLEYLKDRVVLDKLPGGFRWLQKNNREDVIVYFETFAQLLEDQLVQHIDVSEIVNGEWSMVSAPNQSSRWEGSMQQETTETESHSGAQKFRHEGAKARRHAKNNK